jgi:arylsulfatase A-like enzyme
VKLIKGLVAAALAGALGGALVGLVEALLVTFTSGAADEYWLFLFGVVGYGVLGAGIGLGGAILWQIARLGRASEQRLAEVAVALAVFVPSFAIGRYHVNQRLFGEELVTFSAAGVVTHALLLGGGVVVALAALVLLRACYRAAGMAAVAGLLAILLAASCAIGFATGKGEERIARKAGAAAGRPNVILIIADTLRSDAVDWTGAQPEAAGGFATLAKDGVVFDHTYSQASWTRPSIATILTGVYPSVHGTVHKMDFLPDSVLTVAEALKAQGYWTAGFTTNINVAPVFNFQQGFDEFHYLEPSFYFWATDSATKLAIYKGLRVGRERFLSNRMYYEHYYQDAAIVDRHLQKWLDQRPPEPFFLLIHYMDPHDPYFEHPYNGHGVARVMTPSPAPERARELHDLYMEGVHYLDGYVKRLVERLRNDGLYDRSVIAFTADHGEEFHEHGGWWHGTALYQEQVHVPLVIKRAGASTGGGRRSDLARSIDIAPTLFAAARLPQPETFLGVDLFGTRVEEPLLAEEDLEGNRLTSIRSGDWKLIIANPGNPRGLAPTELYNLAQDPEESRNLAAGESARVSDLLAQLERMRVRIAEDGQRPTLGAARKNASDPRT